MSALQLARAIKKVVERNEHLKVEDGTAHNVPASFNFVFGGEEDEASNKIIKAFKDCTDVLSNFALEYYNQGDDLPEIDDSSRDAQKIRNTVFAIRTISSIARSPRGIKRHAFQTRTFNYDDIYEVCNFDYSKLSNRFADSSAMFQFKRTRDTDVNPWNYTWSLVVDGVVISRGTNQPVHKMLSSLIKQIHLDATNSHAVQEAIATLSGLKNDAKPYYWYLSNQDTAIHYLGFREHLNCSTCMSKDYNFYDNTGDGQHPMDAYDDSPDWRIMFISELSPEEILAHVDLVIANPDSAESLLEYPFLTRCMVMPTAKETSGRTFTTPYVFGKMYGKEKLVNFFMNESNSGPYELNDNKLLSGSYAINGGKIRAIRSTEPEYEDHYLLPYFDKANRARLHTDENGVKWWVSTSDGDYENHKEPVAVCSYEDGTAIFNYWWSPARDSHVSIHEATPRTFNTILGEELYNMRDEYREYPINGVVHSIPQGMFIRVDGNTILRSQAISLYDGSYTTMEQMTANPEQFARIDNFGLFNLAIPHHKRIFTAINHAAGNPVEATAADTPLPNNNDGNVFS